MGLPCPSGILVFWEARLITPQTNELPGKDRKDLAARRLWSQGFYGLRYSGPGQTMHSDRYPKSEKRKKRIMNRRSQLPQTKCSFKTAGMRRDDQTGTVGVRQMIDSPYWKCYQKRLMATQKEINHDILYPIHYEHVIYTGRMFRALYRNWWQSHLRACFRTFNRYKDREILKRKKEKKKEKRKKIWEHKQKIVVALPVSCLDPERKNLPICADGAKGRIQTEKLRDTNGQPQIPKSCREKLPFAFWGHF